MKPLQYKVIKTDPQYFKYCDILEGLLESGKKTKYVQDEIELLTLLIETYDDKHNTFKDVAPIPMLLSLITEHDLKAKDLVDLLGVSKGYVSDILNYKKGLSKEVIRKLASHFKMNQEAFNRPYALSETGKKSARSPNKAGNYEKHPFFVKKANEAKALLKEVGLPKQLAKAK